MLTDTTMTEIEDIIDESNAADIADLDKTTPVALAENPESGEELTIDESIDTAPVLPTPEPPPAPKPKEIVHLADLSEIDEGEFDEATHRLKTTTITTEYEDRFEIQRVTRMEEIPASEIEENKKTSERHEVETRIRELTLIVARKKATTTQRQELQVLIDSLPIL